MLDCIPAIRDCQDFPLLIAAADFRTMLRNMMVREHGRQVQLLSVMSLGVDGQWKTERYPGSAVTAQ